jgi:hypothetical protein
MPKRLTIYVADEDWDDVQKFKQGRNLADWFKRAVRRELAAQQKESGKKKMTIANVDVDAVVRRLKAEREQGEREAFQAGTAAGLDWAQHFAGTKDLQAVSNYGFPTIIRQGESHWGNLIGYESPASGFDGWEPAPDWTDAAERNDRAFVSGFVAAVRQVWEAVRDQV